MSDASESWLALAKAGDSDALGCLLQRHRNYLTLLARLQLGGQLRTKLDPSDLIQETALATHRAIARFRGTTEREFRGWLREIFSGVLANQIRRYRGTRARDPRLERGLLDGLDRSSRAIDGGLVAPGTSPSGRAIRGEQALILADALEGLPEDYRDVLILRHLEELDIPEVARRMGRTEDSVKNLWARALARLRRAMEDPR